MSENPPAIITKANVSLAILMALDLRVSDAFGVSRWRKAVTRYAEGERVLSLYTAKQAHRFDVFGLDFVNTMTVRYLTPCFMLMPEQWRPSVDRGIPEWCSEIKQPLHIIDASGITKIETEIFHNLRSLRSPELRFALSAACFEGHEKRADIKEIKVPIVVKISDGIVVSQGT